MERQIMKFKAEMVKEEGLFENLLLNIKDACMEQKTKKELTKSTNNLLTSIQGEKNKLQNSMKQSKLKVENDEEGPGGSFGCPTDCKEAQSLHK